MPFSVPLQGGLNKSTNSLALLRTPGVATKLRNFEVSIEGGYRRINGYTVFGGGSAVRPNTTEDIEGLSVYADGVVAVAGNDIFFSQDGTSYLQINKASVDASGDNFSTFSGRSELSLTSIDQCEFALFEGTSEWSKGNPASRMKVAKIGSTSIVCREKGKGTTDSTNKKCV